MTLVVYFARSHLHAKQSYVTLPNAYQPYTRSRANLLERAGVKSRANSFHHTTGSTEHATDGSLRLTGRTTTLKCDSRLNSTDWSRSPLEIGSTERARIKLWRIILL